MFTAQLYAGGTFLGILNQAIRSMRSISKPRIPYRISRSNGGLPRPHLTDPASSPRADIQIDQSSSSCVLHAMKPASWTTPAECPISRSPCLFQKLLLRSRSSFSKTKYGSDASEVTYNNLHLPFQDNSQHQSTVSPSSHIFIFQQAWFLILPIRN